MFNHLPIEAIHHQGNEASSSSLEKVPLLFVRVILQQAKCLPYDAIPIPGLLTCTCTCIIGLPDKELMDMQRKSKHSHDVHHRSSLPIYKLVSTFLPLPFGACTRYDDFRDPFGSLRHWQQLCNNLDYSLSLTSPQLECEQIIR